MKFTVATVIGLAAFPLAASAVTITPGSQVNEAFVLNPNETQTFDYQVDGPVEISLIAVSGTGFNDGDDLNEVLFGVNGSDTDFENVFDLDENADGSTASASGSLPSFRTSEDFTIDFTAPGATSAVTAGYSYDVAAVPIPAGGGMLLAAMGVFGGFAARRKRKAAQA